eukprot:924045-Pleurochrysis_carterae.AAC.1
MGLLSGAVREGASWTASKARSTRLCAPVQACACACASTRACAQTWARARGCAWLRVAARGRGLSSGLVRARRCGSHRPPPP